MAVSSAVRYTDWVLSSDTFPALEVLGYFHSSANRGTQNLLLVRRQVPWYWRALTSFPDSSNAEQNIYRQLVEALIFQAA